MKRGKSFFAIFMVFAILFGLLERPAAAVASASGSKVSEARAGVVRVLVNSEVYIGGEYIGMAASVGSAFGVGKKGKETDTFVTNRHVVEETKEDMPRILAYAQVYGEAWVDASLEGLLEVYGKDKLTETVSLEYRRARVYLLLDDYAYSDTAGLDTSRVVPCDVLYEARADEPDLAVLRAAEKVKGRVALPLMAAEDGGIDAGDTVYALGYPLSADAATTDERNRTDYAGSVESVTVTSGTVSRFVSYTTENARIIQHTATINGGNSGGPLINADGAVVGVNTINFNGNGVNDPTTTNHSGSIASEHVMKLLDNLEIEYELYSEGGRWLLIGVIAAVFVVAVLVGVFVAKKRTSGRDNKKEETDVADGGRAVLPVQPPADSGVRIQGLSGTFAGRRFSVNGQVRIGRDQTRNNIVYPEGSKGISGVHCAVIESGGQIYLKDLGSTYGTWLSGGQRLSANQSVQLKKGDCFYLATEQESFQVTGRGGV